MIKKVIIMLLVILLSFSLIACDDSQESNVPEKDQKEYTDTLTEEVKNQIISCASKKYELEESLLDIDYFLGGFNNAYSVILNVKYNPIINNIVETIEGYEFNYFVRYRLTNTISIYCNDEIYTLYEAVDKNLLNKEDIGKIKNNFDQIFLEYDSEYFKITDELKEQGLTIEVYNEVRKTFPNNKIVKYLGNYNNNYIVLFDVYGPSTQLVEYKEYDGYVFEIHMYPNIKIVKDGIGYGINEAISENIADIEIYEYIFNKIHNHASSEIFFHDNQMCPQTAYNIYKQCFYDVLQKEDENLRFENYIDTDIYSGTYDESILIRLDLGYKESKIVNEEIAGIVFEYNLRVKFIIYNNGKAYNLKEAYDKEIISKETVEKIYNDYFKK